MKNYLLLSVSLLFSVFLHSQPKPQWLYYSNGSHITCIEENASSIWVGTTAGLVRINKRTMHKTHYNKVSSGLPFNNIQKVFFDNQDRIWVLGYSQDIQLAMLNGNTWTYFRIPEFGQQYGLELTDIVQTPDGNIWVTDYEGLVFIGKNFQAVNNLVEIDTSACQYLGTTYSLETDSIGNLYCGGSWYMQKRDTSGSYTTVYPWGMMQDKGKIRVQEKDPQGVLWIGSHHNGIVCPSLGGGDVARLVGNNWQTITPPGNGFSFVNDICFGSAGEVFIATAGYGVIKYQNNQYTYPTCNMPVVDTNYTTAVHLDQTGALWFGTINGLYRMKDNVIQQINSSNSQLTSNILNTFQKEDGTFLLQVRDEYFHYQPITFTTCLIHNSDTIVPSAMKGLPEIKWKLEDSQGNLWGISQLSLYMLNDTVLTSYTPDTAIFGHHCILFDITRDTVNQKLWVGTDEGLLSFVNNDFVFESYFMNNVYATVTAVFADSTGNLWAGSNGGGVAAYYNGLWTSHNYTWALYNEYIVDITEDKNHALWFNTLFGSLGKYENSNWTVYNPQNSPLSGQTPAPAFSSDNTLYVMDPYIGIWILKNNVWDSLMINSSRLDPSSSSIMIDKNDNLWITGEGITIYNTNGIIIGVEDPSIAPANQNKAIVYPNPSAAGFYVHLADPSQYPLRLALFTIDGMKVWSKELDRDSEVNTGDLPTGTYILNVTDAFGKVFINKLVVEH